MKKIWELLCDYSSFVINIGRLILIICAIILVTNKFNKNTVNSIPWMVIITGIVIYITGWIANRYKQRKKNAKDESVDIESL